MDELQKKKNRDNQRKWRETHPNYYKQYHRKYYEKNATIIKNRKNKWYADNKEHAITKESERYHANKVLKGRPNNEKMWNWKGDKVGYGALHVWVRKYKGTPNKCEFCQTIQAKRYYWANKSREYKRDLDDWLRLCGKCHWRYDQDMRKRDWHGRLL